ncbi:MAG: serpin family protein [Lachnospiraceae bacterium]|nr:serpin family protein [Lachnospiraceae bacterium]
MKHKTNRIIKRVTGVTLIVAATLSLFACRGTTVQTQAENLTKDLNAESVTNRELDDTFRLAAADFSFALFQQSSAEDVNAGKNILISPESVLSALAMTANGANGQTLAEMEEVLCGGMEIHSFNEYMYTYHNRLTATKDVTFHLANSIWLKDEPELQVKEDFLQTDRNYYNADIFQADFDTDTVADINQWVDVNTNGMIPQLLTEIPEGAELYLINALAFEGEWENSYEEKRINEAGTFTDYLGNEETVTMLRSTETQYIAGEHVTGFVKNYKGGDYAFLALLPEEGIRVEDYIASLNGEDFLALYDNRMYQEVLVEIPEFTYDYDTELKDALSSMGMEDAFEPGADFSNMAETDLYISRVLHKTHIQVDRAGTKAAAVTAVEMSKASDVEMDVTEPPRVYLNRPFVYAIVDTETGLPVFLGAVNTIE